MADSSRETRLSQPAAGFTIADSAHAATGFSVADSSHARTVVDSTHAAPDSLGLPAEPQRVGEISVEGNTRTDRERILRTFEVHPGTRYSKDALRRGIRKLFTLGLFQDVWLEELPRGESVDLIVHVRERPRVAEITFNGNRKRETSELEKKLSFRVGDVLTPGLLQAQLDSLIKYYHAEGYSRAHVDARTDTTQTTNQVGVHFDIQEGEKVRVTRIEFVGVQGVSPKRLRKTMTTKQKGLFGGGEIKDDTFTEDRAKLEAIYRNNGYRDVHVVDMQLKPGGKPRDLTLVVQVDEGRRYRFGSTTWSGNHIVATWELRKFVQPRPGDLYDASRVDRAREQAYGEYAERGYLYVNIEPRETVRDSVVDLALVVSEGGPSQVRLVNIAGNRGTREKVIRREITLHEGDQFRRSALMRSHDEIMRLGMFEDVQVDFAPAESTDVDINLHVKEKQVGTASAGAGYTGDTGVTGFLELSHNNVLGNGQSLALHLERGGQREDYNVSFTEPWFRDTPTLLGFSLFRTRLERDVYTEKHNGGSARIGRPLPWPDFTHGSLTYRIENVTVSAIGSAQSIQDSLALGGYAPGVPVLTSSVSTNLSRSTVDNPYYPTRGTRLTLDDEFAGGPFGGKVDFHKHRYEGRLYFPSILRGITTMLRARVGLIGEYHGQTNQAPTYERFRLGGGSTQDPLRGYDDYQVVPDKFIHLTPITIKRVVISGTDTTVVTDTTGYSRVRYPGGRFSTVYSVEQQFPIVRPLRGVLFFDAGNTWDLWHEIRPTDLKMGAGIGFRMEIPLLGNIGLDYGYGFNRDDGPRAKAHFLLGNFAF